jgi:hypothetical protein
MGKTSSNSIKKRRRRERIREEKRKIKGVEEALDGKKKSKL